MALGSFTAAFEKISLPPYTGIPITPRRLFSRTKTPRRKVRDPTFTLPKCPRCEKSKIRKVVDTKFPKYDHYAIRKVRDAKTPRYNKSLTRELPDCIDIENSVACVEYKLERGKIQVSSAQDFFSTDSCRFEFLSHTHSLGICTHTYTVTRASVTLARTHDPMLLSSQVFVPPFPWLNFPFPCFLYRLSIYLDTVQKPSKPTPPPPPPLSLSLVLSFLLVVSN